MALQSYNNSGFAGSVNEVEYITLNQRKQDLCKHFGLKNANEKLSWKMYRYAQPSFKGHHGVVLELLNHHKPFRHSTFSSELMVYGGSRVGSLIRIPGTRNPRYPNCGYDGEFKKEHLFDPEIISDLSIDDIFNKSRECIQSWREYSLIFYNCRHYTERLMALLRNKQILLKANDKDIVQLQTITPDIQCKVDQLWNLVWTGTYGFATYLLMNSPNRFLGTTSLITLSLMFYKRADSFYDILNRCGQNYYQKGGNTTKQIVFYILSLTSAAAACFGCTEFFANECGVKEKINDAWYGCTGSTANFYGFIDRLSWCVYVPVWFSMYNYLYGRESNPRGRQRHLQETVDGFLVTLLSSFT